MSAPLEIDMFIEMIKYFNTDINNIIGYINQCVMLKERFNKQMAQNPALIKQINNINQTITYLKARSNFARNCVSFLTKKIEVLRQQ